MNVDDCELLGRFKKTQVASINNKENKAGKPRGKKRSTKESGLLSPSAEAGSPRATGQGEEGEDTSSKKGKLDEKAGVPPPRERTRSDIANEYVNQWDKEIVERDNTSKARRTWSLCRSGLS